MLRTERRIVCDYGGYPRGERIRIADHRREAFARFELLFGKNAPDCGRGCDRFPECDKIRGIISSDVEPGQQPLHVEYLFHLRLHAL